LGLLNELDIAIIIGSLVLVVSVGLWASRRQEKSARGYFLASGKLPWYLIGAAFVSTSVSSEQIVGTVGATYRYGLGIANWELWCLPVYLLTLAFFIPVYLKNRVVTVPELLSRRFGPLCGDIYSWIMLVAYVVVFMVPILYGGSLAFSELTGWPFLGVLWTIVILVSLYAVKGGLRSVMVTDAVQCLLLVGGGVLLFCIAVGRTPGGWSAIVQANPDRFHLYHSFDDPIAPFWGMIAGSVGVFLFYQSTNQVMIQRVLGARSTWDGIMGIIFAGFINLARPLVTCLLGVVVYHWIFVLKVAPPLDNSDKTFPFALKTLAPAWGLRGIVLSGFIAAVMAAISSLANSTATIFSLDVYHRWIHRQASDRRLVKVGRVASAASLILAALLAPSVEHLGGIFRYFQTGVTFLSTPFISVMLAGLLWKRANYPGALFGLLGGMAIQLGVALTTSLLGIQLHWLYQAFIAQVLILAGIVIVSLLTPPLPPGSWESFVWDRRLLAHYDEGIRRPWYQKPVFWLVVYSAVWILPYVFYW
jgi:solute:Na+ symporter, SSS family